jgi:preprotein translocase subunit SecA
MRMAEKNLLLQVLDQQWKEHLFGLDQLRQGISLRAYAQKDPLNEYKREAFMMFETMLATMRETTSMVLAHVELRQEQDAAAEDATGPAPQTADGGQKVPRNAPCPCGSGKKYKHCHGAL